MQWVYFEILSQVPIALATAGLPGCQAAMLPHCYYATLPGCHSYPINQMSSQACQRRAKVKSCSDIKCAKPWPNRVTVNKEYILTEMKVNDFFINTLQFRSTLAIFTRNICKDQLVNLNNLAAFVQQSISP